METKYLIIGNGVAGITAAKEIRKNDKFGKITIVDKDDYRTYKRLELSHSLFDKREIDDLYLDKIETLEELKIDEIISIRAENIDVKNNKVALANGDEITYEKLLLAVGSVPFIPPYEGDVKENVFKFRTYSDLLQIREKLDKIDSVVISGGGLLGIELAYSFLKLGKNVHIVELGDRLMNRQLDEKTSENLKRDLMNLGMHVHTSSQVKKVLGKDKLEGVLVNDSITIDAQALVFSIGVRSNLEIIPDDIKKNRGIIVDESLRTNIENIWAAGDCAEINGRTYGLWSTSNKMGKIAGMNMTGLNELYKDQTILTNLSLDQIKIFSMGQISDNSIRRESEKGIETYFFDDEDILVGGILYKDMSNRPNLMKAIRMKMRKDEFNED